MVAFRKMIPVLAIMALLLGATSAFAQTTGFQPLVCTANAGVPPIVRAEGYTELVGDLVVTCRGGNPNAPFLANFQLFLNTNITSRLLSIGGVEVSEALLMIDEPGVPRANAAGTVGTPTPFCVSTGPANNSLNAIAGLSGTAAVNAASACNAATNAGVETFQPGSFTVFRATRGNQPNVTVAGSPVGNENLLVWAGVPVVPPGSNRERTFRITNVRANAAGLGASQTLIPTQIVAYISVFPQATLPIDNPQQTVGYVQQGMLFDVRNCSGGSVSGGLPSEYLQCVSLARDWYNDPTRGNNLSVPFALRYREGFQTAFKRRIDVGQDGALPGQVFNSESGFVRTTSATPTIANTVLDGLTGIADTGTRLAARFVNIPANVRLFVSVRNAPNVGDSYSSPNTTAVLVTTDAQGSSTLLAGAAGAVSAPLIPFGPNNLSCGGSNTVAGVEVPLVNGAGVAVWEVTESNPSAIDTFLFYLGVAYRANQSAGQPALGTGQVIGNLAPFYPAGNAERMSGSLVIPRFAQRSDASNIFRILVCQTNLLFPYVTNWANFDTGIAIANTSQDPFPSPADRLQSGRCTMNYYGRLANGNAPTTTREQTDRELGPGEMLTMILSSGGTYGLKGNANFQGYIIATCDFLFAHGFAFITDGPIGQARVAEGYLALVLDGPSSSGSLRGGVLGESRGM